MGGETEDSVWEAAAMDLGSPTELKSSLFSQFIGEKRTLAAFSLFNAY